MEVGHPSKEAMKTCSVRSRHRDQYQSDNRDVNDKTKQQNNNKLYKRCCQFC